MGVIMEYKPTKESVDKHPVPDWYQDAKFGIFIHWGAYSVPAYMSEWYPRMMYIDQDTWRGNALKHHFQLPGPLGRKISPALFDEAGLNYPPANIGDKYVMPDGSEADWSWETLTEVAKMLTVDVNGLTPLDDGFDRHGRDPLRGCE